MIQPTQINEVFQHSDVNQAIDGTAEVFGLLGGRNWGCGRFEYVETVAFPGNGKTTFFFRFDSGLLKRGPDVSTYTYTHSPT